MSLDGNGRYCSLDPREGTKLIVAECCRNLSTVGALPVATTNNLNFGNPERPEIMAQIVESVEGLAEACRVFDVPVTGGNVSLYNETLGTPILPTPVVGIVGIMQTGLPVSATFRQEGRSVMLLGGLRGTDWRQFGGTQYAKVISRAVWGTPPHLDMDYERRLQKTIRTLVQEGLSSRPMTWVKAAWQ
jgi:phosphoribosylformylglycinamidine (FGAM) synthase-like enzyme